MNKRIVKSIIVLVEKYVRYIDKTPLVSNQVEDPSLSSW